MASLHDTPSGTYGARKDLMKGHLSKTDYILFSDGLETLYYRAREIFTILITSESSPEISSYTLFLWRHMGVIPHSPPLWRFIGNVQHDLPNKAKAQVSCGVFIGHDHVRTKSGRVALYTTKTEVTQFLIRKYVEIRGKRRPLQIFVNPENAVLRETNPKNVSVDGDGFLSLLEHYSLAIVHTRKHFSYFANCILLNA